jgi:hypothetical protein
MKVLITYTASKHVIEGRIEGAIRRGRRLKQLLGDHKETKRYRKLKEKARNRVFWELDLGQTIDLS